MLRSEINNAATMVPLKLLPWLSCIDRSVLDTAVSCPSADKFHSFGSVDTEAPDWTRSSLGIPAEIRV